MGTSAHGQSARAWAHAHKANLNVNGHAPSRQAERKKIDHPAGHDALQGVV